MVAAIPVGFGAAPATGASDVGTRGPSYSGVSAPTAEKPQSKLWFNDNTWWGSLFNPATTDFEIHRYDRPARTWVTTGTTVDTRMTSRADVLWDGTHLYVASAGRTTSTYHAGRLYSFSYDPGTKTYTPDAGFPVTITPTGVEALVLAKDGTGTLWATYTSGNQVKVTHSTSDPRTWVSPSLLPVAGANTLTSDDISSVVAFDGRIGVMWSNQNEDAFYFAVHRDGAGDGPADWAAEIAAQGPEVADDHINLKSLEGDPAGQVFAAVKFSFDPPDDPEAVLLVRKADGSWEQHTFGAVADGHTRPMVLIDQEHRRLYMFATAPCCSGGTIYYKQTSLDDPSFLPGLGDPFIALASDPKANNPTSTKQNLDASSALLVLAGDDSTGTYVHNALDLGDANEVPETSIDSGPTGTTTSTSATFSFSSDTPGAGFECRLDGSPEGAFSTCASPASYSGLTLGDHTFEVRAVGAGGEVDPTPARRDWTVAAHLFADGFETGDFSAWTIVSTGGGGTAAVVSGDATAGEWAARLSATSTTGSFAYARATLSADAADLVVSGGFKVVAEGARGGNVPLLRLLDSAGNRLLSLYRQNADWDRVYVWHGGQHFATAATLPLGTWGRFQVRVVTAGADAGTVEVRLNGAVVYSTTTATIVDAPRAIQIGNDTKRQAFTLLADEIVVN